MRFITLASSRSVGAPEARVLMNVNNLLIGAIGCIGHAGIHPIGPAVREIITRAIRNVLTAV